jgi:hypothetical protein
VCLCHCVTAVSHVPYVYICLATTRVKITEKTGDIHIHFTEQGLLVNLTKCNNIINKSKARIIKVKH